MKTNTFIIRPSLALFTIWIFLFSLALLNGYVLSFLGLSPGCAQVTALLVIESALAAIWLRRRRLRFAGDPLGLAGLLLVVILTWVYFIYPSWPTLFPPTYSADASVRYSEIIRTLSGRIITDYPGGPAFLAALTSYWIGWPPIRVMHLLGAIWMALTAGGTYGVARSILPSRRWTSAVALFAPFALFVPWDYFGGILIGAEYFWPQVLGQLFLVAFVWFLAEQLRAPDDLWSVGMGLCLVGISVSFPLWLALPMALLAWAVWEHRRAPGARRSALIVFGSTAIFWGVSLLVGGEFIPSLSRFGIVAIAIVGPSFRTLGGVFLMLPALGLVLSWRGRARVAAAFMIIAALQSLSLQIFHLAFSGGYYWVEKSFFVWIFPFAILSVIPIAHVTEWALGSRRFSAMAVTAGFGATVMVLSVAVAVLFPATFGSPMNEQEIQLALWAKERLDTQQVNYISRKGLIPQWLGAGFWGENYPDDLSFGQAQLGPKTYEDWRDDLSWGKYLYITSDQHLPIGPEVEQVHRIGDAVIVSRIAAQRRPAGAEAPAGRFGNLLALVDYRLPSRTFRSGDLISLTAPIATGSIPAHQVVWRLQLRNPDGSAAAEARIIPFGDKYPLQRWPDGNLVDQQFALALSADLTPGRYGLSLGLYYVGNGDPLTCRLPDGTTDDVMSLGQIKVELPRPTEQELGSLTRISLRLGRAIALLGYRVETNSPARAGDSLKVYLYWQALESPPRDYTAFVHLVDASGVLRAQSDSAPRSGAYPTSIWAPDEIVDDPRTITIPDDARPGEYRIEVGMYEWPSLQRLTVTDAGVIQGDHVDLPQTIVVQRR